jgi:hypothetical protein
MCTVNSRHLDDVVTELARRTCRLLLEDIKSGPDILNRMALESAC